ncbi:hydroxymethylglutaryl-CoA lyase [Candidatus Levibacter sp. Uisw_134_01]|uniref:hydroxymethylglutaryl-CoA lyase n=1 Tax=Candidatus Levibacter sp. Uisw_134_01 TaxID=3230999 RepID=UPI003D390850
MNIREVKVTEVGPRDGFQSEKTILKTEDKIDIINNLIEAGFPRIEVSSFVSPKAIPQLADAESILSKVNRSSKTTLAALVPNSRGALRAVEAKLDQIVVFLSASESHNKKNVNRSVDESLQGFREIADIAGKNNIPIQGDIATAFGCPFEGNISPKKLADISKEYEQMGFKGVTLGDTTGMATPVVVKDAIKSIRDKVPGFDITLHFHNTRGVGLANVMTGLNEGITDYESCFGGMGGCPFAPNATGNICSEDLIYLLHEMGIKTGIDLDKIISVAKKVENLVGHKLPGQVMRAGHRLLSYSMDEVPTAVGA